MTFQVDVLTLIAFLGTFQGLVFSVIFWLKNKNISNKIFSVLLLTTSIRIAKNIFVHLQELNPEIFYSADVRRTLVYAGISHQFAIGPLLLFYIQSKVNGKFVWEKSFYLHFIPYFTLVIISPMINWSFWKYGGLWMSYLSILLYFLLSVKAYFNSKDLVDSGTKTWIQGLLMVIFGLLFAYSPALFHYLGYIGGAILYAFAILGTGYFMLVDKGSLSVFRTKYETSSLRGDKAEEIKKLLALAMIEDRPYLNPELTLQLLASTLEVAPHHLSRVVNQEFEMSFTDYTNSFRLKEAERKLRDVSYNHLKISALAFECGFNSVPTFNTLFKKVHKKTPTQFRSDLNTDN